MSKTSLKTTVEWNNVQWRKLERRVFKLQKRIYRASERGDVKAVRRLQKTLLKSWSARMLAVRRVTQDNQGKRTAGIDGVKKLTPNQRLKLVQTLKLTGKAKPTRRIWIPKPNGEKRGLGIPTMFDRALQALVKMALEPEWEAKFEPNSYGFRPGRSCHDAIQQIFLELKSTNKYVLDIALIKELNPIIRGWSNYYATVVSKETFAHCDHLTWLKLRAWSKRRHPTKSTKWIKHKYWHRDTQNGKNREVFSTREENGYILLKHADTPIKRFVKVQSDRSPYDGDWVYWSQRMGKHPEVNQKVANLLKKQKGKCSYCNNQFTPMDKLEIDHIIPKSKGGKNSLDNLQLLHKHCHDQKSKTDGSYENRRTYDKGRLIEEPCEVKVSSTVLKTSQRGDSLA